MRIFLHHDKRTSLDSFSIIHSRIFSDQSLSAFQRDLPTTFASSDLTSQMDKRADGYTPKIRVSRRIFYGITLELIIAQVKNMKELSFKPNS